MKHMGKTKASTVIAAIIVAAMFIALPIVAVKLIAFDGQAPQWWLAWPIYGFEAFTLLFFGLLFWFSQNLHKQAQKKLDAALEQLRGPHANKLVDITPGGPVFTFIVANAPLQCINVWMSDGEPVYAARGPLAEARAIGAWRAAGLKNKAARTSA